MPKKARIADKRMSIAQTEEKKQKKAMIKQNNEIVTKAKEQVSIITNKFLENPQPFLAEKEKDIAKWIEKYGNLQNEDLENGIVAKKDYALELAHYVSKPILKTLTTPKYTANTLLAVNEFYWEKIVIPINRTMQYIPMIFDLLSLLAISENTFYKYYTNGNEEMREACQIIYNKFVSYYQRNGMQKNISEIMSMFVLKTTYKQRENEVPQVIINNNVLSPNEEIEKLARQYGYETFEE